MANLFYKEKQISFWDIARFFVACVVAFFVYAGLEHWVYSYGSPNSLTDLLISIFFGIAMPAFASIIAGGIIVSWRYKLVTAILLMYPILFLFIGDVLQSKESYVVYLVFVVKLTFAFLGSIAAVTVWKYLADYVKKRYLKKRQKTENKIKPKISVLLVLLSIFSIPFTFIAIIISAFAILGLSAVLGYILIQLPRVPVFLIIAAVIAPLLGIYSALRALWAILLPQPAFQSAIRIEMKNHPKLQEIVDEVCNKVKTAKPNNVILHAEPTFFVTQGKMNTFKGQIKGRTLAIGAPLLKQLNTSELKSILAHEFAHFSGNDTLYSTIVSPVYRGIGSSLDSLQKNTSNAEGNVGVAVGVLSLPSMFFLGLFLHYFATIDNILSRSRELRADLIASSLYGKDIFSNALIKVVEISSYFNENGYDLALKCKDDFFSFYNNHLIANRSILNEYKEKALNKTEEELDSHPNLRTRLFNLPNTGLTPHVRDSILQEFSQEEKQLSDIYTLSIKRIKEVREYYLQIQSAKIALQKGLLVVSEVVANSKAALSGIKINDIILKLCDKEPRTLKEFLQILKQRDRSQLVKLQIFRQNEEITKEIELGEEEILGLNFYEKENK